jgi:hypothetical protein
LVVVGNADASSVGGNDVVPDFDTSCEALPVAVSAGTVMSVDEHDSLIDVDDVTKKKLWF